MAIQTTLTTDTTQNSFITSKIILRKQLNMGYGGGVTITPIFQNKLFGITLYTKFSKNQIRKLNRYGKIPAQPSNNPKLWLYTNKRIKIAKNKNPKLSHYTSRNKQYINIAGNRKRSNNISFLSNSSQDITNKEISSLFLLCFLGYGKQKPIIKTNIQGGI